MMTAGKLDKDSIKELAEILKQTDLSEIEYEANGVKIRVARQIMVSGFATQNVQNLMALGDSGQSQVVSVTDPSKHPGVIKSPMVGTAYLSPEPGASAFIKVGDSVSVGQNLLIIEAMKVMNPIKASKSGIVKQILVRDAEPIEFDTPLLIIE
jgi:acetyl-CoA carboxylase biotin carboxyl carrier protein